MVYRNMSHNIVVNKNKLSFFDDRQNQWTFVFAENNLYLTSECITMNFNVYDLCIESENNFYMNFYLNFGVKAIYISGKKWDDCDIPTIFLGSHRDTYCKVRKWFLKIFDANE